MISGMFWEYMSRVSAHHSPPELHGTLLKECILAEYFLAEVFTGVLVDCDGRIRVTCTPQTSDNSVNNKMIP